LEIRIEVLVIQMGEKRIRFRWTKNRTDVMMK